MRRPGPPAGVPTGRTAGGPATAAARAGLPALELDRVSYRPPGAVADVLRDVSLRVAPGSFVVLAGASGAGKSTLLDVACGLAPHLRGGELAGHVRVGGRDTRDHGPADLATTVGRLAQDPETQVVTGTVRAELACPLENRGHGPAAVARGVEEVALALGIAPLLDRPTTRLSGGELQRVALAATLAPRPRLLLLDEPASQLDPVAGDELLWLLRRLNAEWGTTVVLAEHRLERCLAHADRLVVLDGGAVAADGAPTAVLDRASREAPGLLPPAARLLDGLGIRPLPVGVRAARDLLVGRGLLDADDAAPEPMTAEHRPDRRERRAARRAAAAVRARGVWCEPPGVAPVLTAVDLALVPGERVALMGRNGAGKSTLLRHLAGLDEPTRGRIERAGRVALLLQHPGDYVLHERVGDECSARALAAVGLAGLADRDPRDLSGGERQRLALAVVLDHDAPPAAVLLDEPTRGMDHEARSALLERIDGLAAAGAAVLVATHDAEFAAACSDRTILLADGRPIADGPTREVLSGGWYFATETSRVLGGRPGVVTPEDGVRALGGAAPRGATR